MATDVERLIVRLEATQRQFEKQLAGASRTADRRAKQIETRFMRMNRSLEAGASRLGTRLAAAFAGVASIRAAQQLIDASVRIENALKVAGLAGDDLTKVYDRLFESAQRNAAPVEALVELYSRAALVQNELGISTEELLGFTDQVAVALRVSGKSAQEASGALLQLSQALGSGIVRAEEFNSILEGALPIAQAAAAGLEEAGGSVAKLRQLVVDGEVSSKAFFRAFEAGSAILEEKVASAELTVSQQFVRLQNVLIRVAGDFDKATGASRGTGEALEKLASAIEALGDFMARAANGPIGTFIGKLAQLDEMARRVIETFKSFTLNDEIASALGSFIAPERTLAEGDVRDFAARNALGAVTTGKGDRLSIKTVSLADFPVAPDAGGGRRADRQNELQREIQQITERTAAIRAMTEVQAGLNPLIEDYGYAVERAAAVQELLTAAKRAGVQVTPELRSQIEQLAEGYARAVAEAEQLAEKQDKIRDRADEFRQVAQGALSGFIDDIKNGTDATEALLNALSRVADRLLDIALNSIFDSLFSGGGGGGILSAILGNAKGNAFHGGRVIPFAKGGVVTKPTVFPMAKGAGLMGEAGPEAILPLRRGAGGRLGVEASMDGMNGGNSTVTISLDPGLRAQILEEARGQTIRVVQSNNRAREKAWQNGGNPR